MNTKPLLAIEFNKENVLRVHARLIREAIGARQPGLAQHAPGLLPGRNDSDLQSRSPGQGLDGIRLAAHLPKCSVGSAGTQGFGGRVPSLLWSVVQQNPGACQPLQPFSSTAYQHHYPITSSVSVLQLYSLCAL